jgi:hypothetical protein
VAIPFGIGAKMNVSKKVGIGLEWGPRKTFTDYLDDVSGTYPDWETTLAFNKNTRRKLYLTGRKMLAIILTSMRGNPRTKDWYFFFGVTLNIKLNFVKPPCYSYNH